MCTPAIPRSSRSLAGPRLRGRDRGGWRGGRRFGVRLGDEVDVVHRVLLRAQEVKRHLVSDCGIAETRLKAVGLGESAPYNENDPRADENRRVEFQALG